MADFGSDDSQNPINPFASPAAISPILGVAGEGSEFESIRRTHLNHEASIKSFGFLYYLSGAIAIISGVSILGTLTFIFVTGELPRDHNLFILGLGVIYTLLGSYQIYVARGLRKLSIAGRGGATFFGVLGLLFFPIGTLVSAYMLYLLWSQKGQVIFSPKYQHVLEATPHIVYKTSKVVWIALALLIIFIVIAVAGTMV